MIWLLFVLEPKDLFGLAGALIGLLSLLYTALNKRSTDIEGVKERVTKLETQIGLWWNIVEKQAATILIKPTHYERDLLIERYLRNELNDEELEIFIEMLRAINADKSESPGDRLAAANLGAFAQVKKEMSKLGATPPCRSRFKRWMKKRFH